MVSREELTAWISCPSTRQAHGTRLFPTWLWHSAWHSSFPSLRPSPQLHGGTPLGILCFSASTLKAQSGFFSPATSRREIQMLPGFLGSRLDFGRGALQHNKWFSRGTLALHKQAPPKRTEQGPKKRGKFRRKRCGTDGQEMQTLHPLTLMSSCCCLSCSWSMAGGGSWEMRAWVSSIHGFSSS